MSDTQTQVDNSSTDSTPALSYSNDDREERIREFLSPIRDTIGKVADAAMVSAKLSVTLGMLTQDQANVSLVEAFKLISDEALFCAATLSVLNNEGREGFMSRAASAFNKAFEQSVEYQEARGIAVVPVKDGGQPD